MLDHTAAGLRLPASAEIHKVQAIRIAGAHVRLGGPWQGSGAALAVLPQSRGARLVWRALLSSRAPLASYEVLVDARTSSSNLTSA
jgi:hypothetical protein